MNAPPLPSLYNPRSQSDDTAFVDAFVARHALLETLLRRLRGAEPDGLTLHHILIGPRGMGKTSLLRRIAIAIGQETELAERFIPLSFREEQYNVLTLGDFWRNCGESLAEWAEAAGYPTLAQRLDGALLAEAWASDEAAAEQFSAEMRALGRQAVLLVDNLDLILDALPKASDWALRRRLQARGGPILIGASTHPLRQAADRDAAFYEFFQPAYLEPLDDRETEHCMRALARRGGEHGARVLHILDTQPERLRTLHNLTGGNPRVLALIYRLLGTGESAAAMADLELLLDQVTPYYKAKIEEYQTAQQKAVIDAIALHWDPVTTGDLARLTRVPATTLSPLLIRLRKDGLIETIELSGAYDGHQLVERFLNIWYLMRNGTRRTKQKMRWLVAFLTSFYSLSDLTEIAGRTPDRAVWQPDFRFAFEAALERQALRSKAGETGGVRIVDIEASRSLRVTQFDVVADDRAADSHGRDRRSRGAALDQAQAAMAMVNKAVAIGQMGDSAAAIALYDEVIARFGDAPEPGLREQVARALVNKAYTLGQMGDRAVEIALYDEVIARFGDAPEPGRREQVARALFNKALTLRDAGQIAAAIDTLRQFLQRASNVTGIFTAAEFARARVALANMLLDWQGDLIRPEALYRDAAATSPLLVKANLAWVYLLANRMADARRELLALSGLPPVSLALVNAGIELVSDNFGSATSHIAIALEGDLHAAGANFGGDFERLLRLAHQKGYGERLLAWFEQTTFVDKFTPIYAAFKAYVRTEALLLDINPEIRGPAKIIYDRLDAPRRHAAESAPKQPKPQRRARNSRRRGGS
jgi:tetratricopeptide (TPR) repeat protein